MGGATFLGKALITLQQPKMALAAIVAIALQLAAVLAMLVGNGKTDVESNAGLNNRSNARCRSGRAERSDSNAAHRFRRRTIATSANVAGSRRRKLARLADGCKRAGFGGSAADADGGRDATGEAR